MKFFALLFAWTRASTLPEILWGGIIVSIFTIIACIVVFVIVSAVGGGL